MLFSSSTAGRCIPEGLLVLATFQSAGIAIPAQRPAGYPKMSHIMIISRDGTYSSLLHSIELQYIILVMFSPSSSEASLVLESLCSAGIVTVQGYQFVILDSW